MLYFEMCDHNFQPFFLNISLKILCAGIFLTKNLKVLYIRAKPDVVLRAILQLAMECCNVDVQVARRNLQSL